MTCPAFWLENPAILWAEADEFFPFTENDKRCTAAALNSFTRFGIYLGLLLALVRLEVGWLIVGVVFAAFAVGAWFYMDNHGAIREGFGGPRLTDAPIADPRDVADKYVPDVIGTTGRTQPTAANPFMNVLLTEISDSPHRSPAADVQGIKVKSELDSYFDTMFAGNPGDVFGRTQSQRQWVTMPSTTIPNDRAAFADWLYRIPGKTCKEGNQEACTYFTTADDYPWRSIQTLT
jgi:hypothetical protein